MLQEEIARLTGTLKFNVDARPLQTFEKRLGGVMNMLRELSTLANKKFTVKVALDSRSLRSQIEKATNTKISLRNVDISQEALAVQGKRIQEYLNKTTINLNNVKVDISKLITQKKFVKTLLGQMDVQLPIKLKLSEMESELRKEVKVIGDRNPIKLRVEISHNQLVQRIRAAMRQAEKGMRELKIRVAEPQVRLKVDKQHLIDEIRQAIAAHQFDIRINARNTGRGGAGGFGGSSGSGSGRSQIDRGLSSAMGFARGALPGLGAAFALSQMNDINQRVTAATNSLEAVSGDKNGSTARFDSNRNFVNNLVKEMGLNFRDVAPQFSSIFQAAAPSIGVKGTQDMFRGIMQYGTVHGLDKEAMKGSMVALSQMFGKDKIQSEEARQQFAERMPNGMAMLAEAAFNAKLISDNSVKAFGDLMQKGNADPKKILPELGKLMKAASERNDAYRKSLETTRVAQGRMNNAFEDAVVIFSRGGFDKGMGGFFNTLADSMNRAHPLILALGKAFEILIGPVNALIRLVGTLGENWDKISEALGVSSKALATFATAVAIFMLPFGEFIVALGAAAMILDDITTFATGGDSLFGRWVESTEGARKAIDDLVFALDGLEATYADLKDAFKDSENPFKDWTIDSFLMDNLRYIKSLIDGVSAAMRAAIQFKQGNYGEALSTLGGGVKDVIENNPGVKLYQKIPEFWQGQLSNMGDGISGWAQRQRTDGKMPQSTLPISLMDPRQQRQNDKPPEINLGGLTINAQPMDGSDPKAYANAMAPHIQEITHNAIRDAFGAARAQQAERQ